jgi:hypothetical protein
MRHALTSASALALLGVSASASFAQAAPTADWTSTIAGADVSPLYVAIPAATAVLLGVSVLMLVSRKILHVFGGR